MPATDTARFCPSCGARRQQEWRFCAACGAAVDGQIRRSPAAALGVFGGLVLVGVGIWVWILQPAGRSGPPGSPTEASGPVVAGGSGPGGVSPEGGLPEGHPPIERPTIPDDVKQFIATLVEETERTPDSVEAWTQLSEVQYRAARIDPSYYDAALASFEHLQKIDPDNPTALRGQANVHYDRQEYATARPYFERYLEERPDDHAAQTDLATVRMHLGEVDEAIAGYREIIAADPTFVQAHYNLGVALHRTGDKEGAIAAFRRAREITTDDHIRARIDLILDQLGGSDGTTVAAAEHPSPPGDAAGDRSPFQQSIETFFRTHQIVGPKLVAVEWTSPTEASVKVRDFPMSAMPPFAREKFTSRIRDALKDAKGSNGVTDATSVAIVDAATGQVMETLRD